MDPIVTAPVDVGETGVVMEEAPSGLPLIAVPSALTGLHFFDGLAMRDRTLTVEQSYRRALAAVAARAGGSGVAWGLDVQRVSSDHVTVGAGLAVDGLGRAVLAARSRSISMPDLIEASRVVPPAMHPTSATSPEFLRCIRRLNPRPVSARASVTCWVVTVAWAEAQVSESHGSLEREGVRVRAAPLSLRTALARSKVVALDARLHLRSLTASAFFADEWAAGGSLVSATSLRQAAWCHGARWDARTEIPIAVVAMADQEILFVDRWIVCREMKDASPARYWAGVMRMRSWSTYLAQILQFQCQLESAGVRGATPVATRCGPVRTAIDATASYLSRVYALWQTPHTLAMREITPEKRVEADILLSAGGASRLELVMRDAVAASVAFKERFTDRLLIRHGIVELPPAGYLPIASSDESTANEQVRALMGEGVDLRFCIVPADAIAHELEKAQHMERISLLTGLDDPARKPEVDIFVPDGKPLEAPPAPGLYDASVTTTSATSSSRSRGTARRAATGTDGATLFAALAQIDEGSVLLQSLKAMRAAAGASAPDVPAAAAVNEPTQFGVWITASTDRKIRALRATERAKITGRLVSASIQPSRKSAATALELSIDGTLTAIAARTTSHGVRLINSRVDLRFTFANHTAAVDAESTSLATRRLSFLVDLRWKSDATGGEMTATVLPRMASSFMHAIPILTVRKDWGGTPSRTTVSLTSTLSLDALFAIASESPGDAAETSPAAEIGAEVERIIVETPEPFCVMTLVDNVDVARSDNPLHRLAATAVGRVQAALDSEPTFARDALASLFPPPAPAEFLVQSTLDWVLFRRRRQKRCSPPSTRAAAGVRDYRLFAPKMANVDAAKKLVDAVRQDTAVRSQATRLALDTTRNAPAEFISFAGTGIVPLDDSAEVRAAWSALAPGKNIVGAFVTSSRSEPAPLLLRRLRAVMSILAPDVVIAAGAPVLALAEPTAALDAVDADGFIFLITT